MVKWGIKMDHYNLEESMKRFKYGDKTAFDEIYELTNKFVFYYAFSILKDYETAKDVMQNTYLNIMQKISLYQEGTNPNAWITTITRNLALDEINKNKKFQPIDVMENEYLFGVEEDKYDIDTPLLDLAKKVLPEDEFQIVLLCVIGEHTRDEVSKMLNKPLSTITWKYLNAMRKLKKKIKEGGEYDEK
jgi:RNA polymerase sigma-70 factor (ECF subfamily)